MNHQLPPSAIAQNDLLSSGLLTAILGLIVKTQAAPPLYPGDAVNFVPCRSREKEVPSMSAERAAHGHLPTRR